MAVHYTAFMLDFASVSVMRQAGNKAVSHPCQRWGRDLGPFHMALIWWTNSQSIHVWHELIAAEYFEAVFTLGADWILIGLCWINVTLFDLFVCLYSATSAVRPFLLSFCLKTLTSDFSGLWVWPTSGGINKLSHGLLTIKFWRSFTGTFTAAAAVLSTSSEKSL